VDETPSGRDAEPQVTISQVDAPASPSPPSPRSASGDSLESEATAWLEVVSGEKKQGSFAEWLKDGQVLCKVVNNIQPGMITKVHTQSVAFKQMENIAAFTSACRKLGVLEKDVFSTVDLYEAKNLKAVCLCIHNLGSAIRNSAPAFHGPYLGVVQNSNVKDAARVKQHVTQNSGLRKDVDAEVKAGAQLDKWGCLRVC